MSRGNKPHVLASCDNSLYLPSDPSYVQIGNLNVTGDQLTVEALINLTTPFTGGPTIGSDIVTKYRDFSDVNYLLRVQNADITTTTGFYQTLAGCDIEINKTYHVAMVYDGSFLKYYRNGFLMDQVPASGNLIQNNWPTQIGHYFSQYYNTNFIGYINEVRIWNVARTQSQIRTYMNTSLPTPATQTGLLAYYTFDDLLNKQGNAAWNGTLNGAAQINQSNPTCAGFVADSCNILACQIPQGTLTGSSICSINTQGLLTFHSPDNSGPFTLTYSDGVNTYVQANVLDSVPFPTQVTPAATTTYTLLSIMDAANCSATALSGITATVTVGNCSLCSGALGDPVVNISFGSGSNPGPPLSNIVPGASTTLQYIAVSGNPASPTPVDGQYTITNNVPVNSSWFSGAGNHTPNDPNGYMAFYNSSEQPGEFYQQSISGLCGSTIYQFAAWVANALDPSISIGVRPDITFIIEQTDGTVLASYDTGPVAQNNSFTWNQFGFSFITPSNVSTVILKMINNSPGGNANFGNDLAIDDITFRACGPSSTASFSNNTSIDSIAICEGSDTTLYGVISSGYANPGYLWQVSQDNGSTWTDVPNSNSLQIHTTTPITGITRKYKYRVLAAEGSNINSSNCRVISNLVILTSLGPPLLTITPSDTSICEGSSVQLHATAGLSYTWSPAQFLDNPNTGDPVASPDSTTTFSLQAFDSHHCINIDSVILRIRPLPVFHAPPGQTACVGFGVLLKSDNDSHFRYAWSPAQFLSDPYTAYPMAVPDANMLYTVTISDSICNNYDSSFQVKVDVKPSPTVTARKANDIDCSVASAPLQASGAQTYSWSPATGLTDPLLPNPVAFIDSTTTYIVKGTDQNGCYAFDTLTVKVTATGKNLFIVPNAFSPNGDGHNDCFGISRWGDVSVEEFSVYNRWGQRVFTTRNPAECWNGNFSGRAQEAGAYAYVIKAKSFCGKITRTGIVMLVR